MPALSLTADERRALRAAIDAARRQAAAEREAGERAERLSLRGAGRVRRSRQCAHLELLAALEVGDRWDVLAADVWGVRGASPGPQTTHGGGTAVKAA